MANQIKLPEMPDNVKSYLHWLEEQSGCESELGKILYATDFEWIIEDDKNRAEAGLKWRDRYANDVGSGLNDVQRDRIRKSIHGKACVFEVILGLAYDINEIVNDEPEPKIKDFFGILLENLGLNAYDDETFDYREKDAEAEVGKILRKWMDREYEKNGKFCIFPVTDSVTLLKFCDTKVSQTANLWFQMNKWIEANSDENARFVTENCHIVTVLK